MSCTITIGDLWSSVVELQEARCGDEFHFVQGMDPGLSYGQ